ncbi:MAG: hypothetical protein KAQ62_26695 [Cyclobacteriaceae bacterium]|nr:hypothetical protein [Cyclobacteriaceae bacterium]
MGPKTIPLDSFNYNERIAQHQQEQMLLNMVRLRYGEVPLFMNVNSMINSYTRQGNVGVGTTIAPGGNSQKGDISGSWSDKPTITYTPMAGAAFSKSLLTPLPPAIVFFLVQSGWSVNWALQGTTNIINGHTNSVAIPRRRVSSSPEYDTLLAVIERIQDANSLGLKMGTHEEIHTIDLYFPETAPNESVRNDIAKVKRLLQLRSDLNSFPIVYGMIQESDEEIVVQTRSILEILVNLSYHIEVPEEHITEGITGITFIPTNGPGFQIESSKEKPDHALVAISTRDYWYYIDDKDLPSKNMFAFVQILMSLTADGQSVVSPLISIGN